MNRDNQEYQIAALESLPKSFGYNATSGSHIRQNLLCDSILNRSGGPWLVVNQNQVVFDGVNAGCGLGYNSGPLFGTAQYAGAWSADWQDPDVQAAQAAYQSFFQRKPRWQDRVTDLSSPSQMIRSYISMNVLEQFETGAADLTSKMQVFLTESASRILQSQAIEFLAKTSVTDRRIVCEFVHRAIDPLVRLLRHGILADCRDGTKAVIEIPLAATQSDLQLLAERLIAAWSDKPVTQESVSLRDYGHYYHFHVHLINYKQQVASGSTIAISQVLEYLNQMLPPELRGAAELQLVTRNNWPTFRQAFVNLQKAIYEPVRQTSATTFDSLFQDDFGYGLLVRVDGQIAGMASAGPLVLFPDERGTIDDERRDDRQVLYPLDLTVIEKYRGSLGTYLKRGLALIGLAAGHRAFHGRNRDRLAAAMWAINLSLGSYQIRHLANDYPDSHQYRDCIYYRCPLRWPKPIEAIAVSSEQDLGQAIARMLYC